MIFLDAAATTPVRREVLEAMWPYLTGDFGNPSSHHSLGDSAAAALAGARAAVGRVLGCRPGEVVFTSGGTEADNLAVKGIALARQAADPRLNRVVISAVEHPAVEESARYLERFHGFAVDVVPVDGAGPVTPESALAAVLRPETALVSIMYANNEVGTVQPVARPRRAGPRAGHPLPHRRRPGRRLAAAGHRRAGRGRPEHLRPQARRAQRLRRPCSCAAGPGWSRCSTAAARSADAAPAPKTLQGPWDSPPHLPWRRPRSGTGAGRVAALRDAFIARCWPGFRAPSSPAHPRNGCPRWHPSAFPGTSGESVLLELERQGVVCSSGSACAAGSDEPSPVLMALGIAAEVAQTAVRFSFDSTMTAAELQEAAAAVRSAVGRVQALGATDRVALSLSAVPGPLRDRIRQGNRRVSGAGRGGRSSAAAA